MDLYESMPSSARHAMSCHQSWMGDIIHYCTTSYSLCGQLVNSKRRVSQRAFCPPLSTKMEATSQRVYTACADGGTSQSQQPSLKWSVHFLWCVHYVIRTTINLLLVIHLRIKRSPDG
ncbi:hypothetical protein LSH36_107g13052 [Paralvinella palmiformis]|uniref:Uncharacterized protein n=1 Tax=Paralvinella palmiformis TaxID=53620 RepID=A0AAD9NCA8_9ANNE|nr:hypothetical protein LSH36_107g13052 [Paralvinella palmiformis]